MSHLTKFKTTAKLVSGLFSLAMCSMVSGTSVAGAISDDMQIGPFSCDKRVELWSKISLDWCTTTVANEIRNKCYVVVHSLGLVGKACGWQGCGMVSLVGEAAKKDGTTVIEYGVRTEAPLDSVFEILPSGDVLPKRPYPRHYLKASEALAAKKACPKNPLNLPLDVSTAICEAPKEVLNMNPYWICMNSL